MSTSGRDQERLCLVLTDSILPPHWVSVLKKKKQKEILGSNLVQRRCLRLNHLTSQVKFTVLTNTGKPGNFYDYLWLKFLPTCLNVNLQSPATNYFFSFSVYVLSIRSFPQSRSILFFEAGSVSGPGTYWFQLDWTAEATGPGDPPVSASLVLDSSALYVGARHQTQVMTYHTHFANPSIPPFTWRWTMCLSESTDRN